MAIAFFDVDETIINVKSMFTFLEFYLSKTGKTLQGLTYIDIMEQIKEKTSAGCSRTEINKYYYNLFEGEYQQEVQLYAKKYFDKTKKNIFKRTVLERLRNHLKNNDVIVLVSGSMPDIIQPIANFIGVNQFLCSTPETRNGRYTGKLVQQSIGENKSFLIKKYVRNLEITLSGCYAYGDHISDIPMLELVGYPFVVDPDEEFAKIAKQRNWEIIFNN